MARNTKLKGKAKHEKQGHTVLVQLDAETARIWSTRKKYDNMSEWVRNQLRFHYGNALAPEQRLAVLKEEYVIAQQVKKKALAELEARYDEVIFAKAREIHKAQTGEEIVLEAFS
jgi:Arc/MetJ-type ribon-helix-helix transcriptional regulator